MKDQAPISMTELNALLAELENERVGRIHDKNTISKMSITPPQQNELNIITQQLDLTAELDRLYHLINGHEITRDAKGEYWTEPEDDRMKVFSEYGAKQLMNYILFYINKNTLLSHYKEEMIDEKMYIFSIELLDFIYTSYEHIFYYPSPEKKFAESIEVIKRNPYKFRHLIKKKDDGIYIDGDKLYQNCIEWCNADLQDKIRHYPMIILAITDSVHSTMLRALNGEERISLRKYMQIHQSINQNPLPEKKGLLGGILGK